MCLSSSIFIYFKTSVNHETEQDFFFFFTRETIRGLDQKRGLQESFMIVNHYTALLYCGEVKYFVVIANNI